MTSVWLVTNGGDGSDGDEWLLKSVHATEASAKAAAAAEKWHREVEEWDLEGSVLTDAERDAISMAASACDLESSLNVACNGRQSFADMWSDRAGVLRLLLERLK
jgi:hypothetical protein